MDVKAWLDSLDLGQYAAAFAGNDIDAASIGALSDSDLKEIGVASLGHRRKLLAAIKALNGGPATAVAPKAPPGPEGSDHLTGERRQVTILFADLSGYTRLSTTLDAEDLRSVMDRVFAVIDGIIVSYGGAIDKHMGDEVMALFGAPIAHSDDPQRAVRAATDIHDAIRILSEELGRPLAMHIGIASGAVVAGGVGDEKRAEYTVLGDAVNLAARLISLAKPGETLMSATVLTAVADMVDSEPLGEVEVKGLPVPVSAFRLKALRVRSRAGLGRFVGRRSELRQFTGAVEGCREAGAGQTVVLRGEAGMGKTRLSEEFASIALARGFSVHRVLVLDFGVGKDQDAIRALLRGLVGIAPGAAEPERRGAGEAAIAAGLVDAGARLFLHDLLGLEQSLEDRADYEAMDNATRNAGKQALITNLVRRASANTPLMLIVEDVHWADRMILNYLAALAVAVADCPAVLVMTTRVEGDPLNLDWRSLTRGSPLLTIDLAPLRKEEAVEMAKGFLKASDRFALASIERAEGNPLFLEQLLRNAEERGSDEIPASIQSLVLSRMDRLAPGDKRALQAASVIGQRFSPDAVRHLIGDDAYTCRALLEHHLVRPEGDLYLFAHALIQEGVYSSLLNATKRQLHLLAAEWFAGQDPVLEAQHLERAGDERAPAAFLGAARAQARQYHFDSARMLVERGLAIVTDIGQRCELMGFRGEMLYALGDISGSIETFRALLDAAETDAQRIPGWIGFAEGMRLIDKTSDGLEALAEAEAAATEAGRDLDLAHIHHLRGNLLFPSGDFDACRIEHEKALAFAERAESAEYTARALGGLGDAYYASGHMLTAHSYLQQCIDMAQKHGFGSIEVAYLFMRGDTFLFMGQVQRAWEDARRTRDMAGRVGNRRAEVFATWVDVDMAFFSLSFDPEVVRKTVDRMHQLVDQLGLRRATPMLHVGEAMLALHEGNFDAIDPLMEQAYRICVETGVGFAGPWILGSFAVLTRKPERRAWALAEGERVLGAERCLAHNYIFFYQPAIEASLEDKQWSEAARFCDLLEVFMRREPTPLTDLIVACGRALARHGRGERDPALIAELHDQRQKAAEFGFERALRPLDAALAGL
ncbi:MAG: adenylate/guanylate cyclase domain-containing protein [Cucumibacter sp.]